MTYTFNQLKASYTPLWDGLVVVKEKDARAEASKIVKYKSYYQALEAKTDVPWFCIGIIHTREAGSVDVGRWQCVLHNGERIVGTGRKTRLVPPGKGPFATFLEAAVDALKGYRGQTWTVEFLAYTLEKFNGFGYRSKGIPSPYLWGGTNKQKCGKYVSDRKYDPNTMDPQIGGMALLDELMKLDPSVTFSPVSPSASVQIPGSTKPETSVAPVVHETSAVNTSSDVPVGPSNTSSPKMSVPRTQKGLLGSIAAGTTAALTSLQHHRLEIVGTAILLVAAVLLYHYWLKPKLWSNPSPKATELPSETSSTGTDQSPPSVVSSGNVPTTDPGPSADGATADATPSSSTDK